jgi:hypothetical protein
MQVGDLVKYVGSPSKNSGINHHGIVTKIEFGGRKVWYCQLASGELSWSSSLNLEAINASR